MAVAVQAVAVEAVAVTGFSALVVRALTAVSSGSCGKGLIEVDGHDGAGRNVEELALDTASLQFSWRSGHTPGILDDILNGRVF